ncbi:imidazole glycerol phosphate synthase subunit HisH [Alphaproteobacteria bacterium]|nr:imidazole glycerol phosphate synthase subunit HisH [Alphaproteobacteria bacterium]
MISIIDHGCGNLHSIYHALKAIGKDVRISSNVEEILSSSGAVLPGVGAFGPAMQNLQAKQLDQVVVEFAQKGNRLMCICLGMHLLSTQGAEFGNCSGLGLIPGRVEKLEAQKTAKVPNVGWRPTKPTSHLHKFDLASENFYYYTHSYEFIPDNFEDIALTTYHGEKTVVAGLVRDNIVATQFHPEKSGEAGLELLGKVFDGI